MNPSTNNNNRDTFALCSGAATEMEQLRRLLNSSMNETRVDAATRMLFRSSSSIDHGNGAIVAMRPKPETYTGTTMSLSDRMFSATTTGTSNSNISTEDFSMLPSRRRSSELTQGLPPTASVSIKSLSSARRSTSTGGGGFPMPRLHKKISNPFKEDSTIPEKSKNSMFASVQLALKLARGGSVGSVSSLFDIDRNPKQPQGPKYSSFPMPKMEQAFAKSVKLKSRKHKPYNFKSFEKEWIALQIQMPSSSSLFGNQSHDDWTMTRELFLRKALRNKNLHRKTKR
ncbi:MAG: hypothetical protein SGILL_003410 [Bacillariaceae sp.]